MKVLRTPDERFQNLPGYSFAPHYVGTDGVRIHYVDEGPHDAPPVLLLHGEPSWSFLYRTMIPVLLEAGHRAVAPDLVGFGRSDKPADRNDYTYQRHIDWMLAVVEALDLRNITLFCQDWGGLIGLRLVADHPQRFSRVIASNTFLPTGDMPLGDAFHRWKEFALTTPTFDIGRVVANGCARAVPDEVIAAYNAPFPSDEYTAGARQFPALVPASPNDPAAPANRGAWEKLSQMTKPFLTLFADSDPITRGADLLLQTAIPGAEGQAHATIQNAGHFIQEDAGEELAKLTNEFIAAT
ncbi:MAG: haloalkane dehalogenase [Actinomycetota bacterium]